MLISGRFIVDVIRRLGSFQTSGALMWGVCIYMYIVYDIGYMVYGI